MDKTAAAAALALLDSRLATVEHILGKAEAHFGNDAARLDELAATRIAPDMLELRYQPHFAAKQAILWLDWSASAAQDPGPGEGWAGMREGVATARARLAEAITQAYAPPQDERVMDLGVGILEVSTQAFFDDFVLPNLYFHLTTTYAILRAAGVPLGKGDAMTHMFAAIRPRP